MTYFSVPPRTFSDIAYPLLENKCDYVTSGLYRHIKGFVFTGSDHQCNCLQGCKNLGFERIFFRFLGF